MPIGVIVNSLSVVLGGVAGTLLGGRMKASFKDSLNMIFGLCSCGMGIGTIVLMKNMPVVVFSIIIGTVIGLWLHLGEKVAAMGTWMKNVIQQRLHIRSGSLSPEEFDAQLLTIIVLFCASGTAIYGSMVAGMSGDHSILISKSILDFFTAMIFACMLGPVVSMIALPQCLIFLVLFALGRFIFPLTTPVMVDDFKAVGGLLLFATGLRIMNLKMFPVADMIPAMVIAMPVSWAWTAFVAPLIGG